MPIEPPRLDDLRSDRVVEDLIRRIPVYTPEWTDHNDSDPGITLLQLFGHLAEQVGYRLNRVPEKNHVELLKLLGVRLQPAHAATTLLALVLTDPSTLVGYTLARGARARAKKGEPPPSFETDVDVDVVPAEPTVLLATRNPFLHDLFQRSSAPGDRDAPSPVPEDTSAWLSVSWDGKAPKPKDLPLDPVPLFRRDAQGYLWVGVSFNPAIDAGFRGARVTLTVQLDDDEQPDLARVQRCEDPAAKGEAPSVVDWLWYWDVDPDTGAGALKQLRGRIDDTTERLTRSGTLRFTVPDTLGRIADAQWVDLQAPSSTTPLQACLALGEGMLEAIGPLNPSKLFLSEYQTVVGAGISKATTTANTVRPRIVHPLDPQLRSADKVKGWLRVSLEPRKAGERPRRLRALTFNAVPATHATTVTNEIVGRGNGRPDQELYLAHPNVLPGTLQLQMRESADPAEPLRTWHETPTLDDARPDASEYVLDPEAGKLTFGDGQSRRIPPLVPGAGELIARTYRHGGGKAGEVPAGAVESLETPATGISNAVNVVAARGGRDAETLEQAKVRARKELSTRSRAVTASDFEWLATQTPGVRVARAHVVPLRRPLPRDAAVAPLTATCGTVPAGPAGLADATAAGVVSVVVVPDTAGPEPVPTPSFLSAVCRKLDGHRLVTTELYVVPPQYARLCNTRVWLRARTGYTRSRLQALVEASLARYLHVLHGGADGQGFPFGGQLHVADLIAQVFRTEGVDRVEDFTTDFTRTKSNPRLPDGRAAPRQGRLMLCPPAAAPEQTDALQLAPEENVSFDASSLLVTTVA